MPVSVYPIILVFLVLQFALIDDLCLSYCRFPFFLLLTVLFELTYNLYN